MIRRLQLFILQYAANYLLADLSVGNWIKKNDKAAVIYHVKEATRLILDAKARQDSAEKLAGPEHPVRAATRNE